MSDAKYRRPRSIDDALDLLATNSEDVHLLAGGTALMLLRKQGLINPAMIVDLAGIPELDGIKETRNGGLAIGAMATLRSVETSRLVLDRAPVLAAVLSQVATVRIRNQATLGGNLAHADPAQDPPPILLALDAELEIIGPAGRRRESVDEFFVDVFETVLAPEEILVSIRVPRLPASSRIGYEKFLPRTADDYATVSVAARLDLAPDGTIEDARIALGAVASVPLRVRAAEALLRGEPQHNLPLDAVAAEIRDAVDPTSDVRGSADYKRDMAAIWTHRLLGKLARLPAAAASA